MERIADAARFDKVFGREIERERANQDKQWGGPEHDDRHELRDWCNYIDKQVSAARRQAMKSMVWDGQKLAVAAIDFEDRMVKIAALAVAAVESSRRKRK